MNACHGQSCSSDWLRNLSSEHNRILFILEREKRVVFELSQHCLAIIFQPSLSKNVGCVNRLRTWTMLALWAWIFRLSFCVSRSSRPARFRGRRIIVMTSKTLSNVKKRSSSRNSPCSSRKLLTACRKRLVTERKTQSSESFWSTMLADRWTNWSSIFRERTCRIIFTPIDSHVFAWGLH